MKAIVFTKTVMILSTTMAMSLGLVACGENLGSKGASTDANAIRADALKDSITPYPVADAERTMAVDELVEARKKMKSLEAKLIAPAQEDLDQYEEFLKDPATGLARVFPRQLDNERRPLLVNGEGAYYQFKGRTNEYGQGSDLEYSLVGSPKFAVGFAGVDFGFFAQLGKADIRSIDMSQSAIVDALSFSAPNGQQEPAWRAEQRKWSAGVVMNGNVFKNITEAVVGMSYIVRSIDESGYDTATVFQVVRRDPTDGSLIIAWKLVKEFAKPVMAR